MRGAQPSCLWGRRASCPPRDGFAVAVAAGVDRGRYARGCIFGWPRVGAPRLQLAAASLDGYAAGLADAGYHVDQAALERAYAVNAIVRWALLLHPLAAVTRPEEMARRAASQRRPFEEIIALIARRTRYLFPLVTACEPLSVGRWTKSAHSPG